MIEVKHLLFARRGIVDKVNNTLSVIDIVEEIGSPVYPFQLFDTSLIIMFARDEQYQGEMFEVVINMRYNDVVIATLRQSIDLISTTSNRLIVSTPALQFKEPGILKFEILRDEQIIGEDSVKFKQSVAEK